MTADEAALRATIAANPLFTDARLLLADELMEQGRAREAALQRVLADTESDEYRLAYAAVRYSEGDVLTSEFVRVQVEIAKLPESARTMIATGPLIERLVPHMTFTGATPEQEAFLRASFENVADLQRREKSLWITATHNQWFDLGVLSGSPVWSSDRVGRVTWRHLDGQEYEMRVARGFVQEVTCSAADWLANGDAICEQQPVTTVTLTDRPQWGTYPKADGYGRLVGREKIVSLGCIVGRNDDSELLARLLKAEWPRINFTLPLPTLGEAVNYDEGQHAAVEYAVLGLRAAQQRFRDAIRTPLFPT